MKEDYCPSLTGWALGDRFKSFSAQFQCLKCYRMALQGMRTFFILPGKSQMTLRIELEGKEILSSASFYFL